MLKRITLLFFALMLFAGMAWAVDLNGAGATFPAPIYSKWFDQFEKETGTRVNYQAIGSGGGIRQFTAGVVDFGATDAFMTQKEMESAGGDVLHIPTVMGSVAIVYNLSGVAGIKLDGDTLAGIYLGDIRKWNDEKISALNPGKNLPDKDITVVHRSDASGTTSIFTNYLAKVSTGWASKVGADKSVSWPVGIGGKGNFGVAGSVKQITGSIGYVELAYALENQMTYASIKNRSGNFVEPDISATSAAAEGGLKKIPSDFRIDMTNMPGAKSYPIVGMTWLLVHKNQKDSVKGQALKDMLKWCMDKGQKYAEGLHYAPLPDKIIAKVKSAIDSIE